LARPKKAIKEKETITVIEKDVELNMTDIREILNDIKESKDSIQEAEKFLLENMLKEMLKIKIDIEEMKKTVIKLFRESEEQGIQIKNLKAEIAKIKKKK
jgi:hypothetical protein